MIMKQLVVFCLVALAVVSAQYYDARYENFNVDEIIDNNRLLKSFTHCFIGDGKCSPDGLTFKRWIPEAIQTRCTKCTPKQKVLIAKVMKAQMNKLPQDWEKLLRIYDRESVFKPALLDFVRQYAP